MMRVFAALVLSALPLTVFPQTTNDEVLTRAYDLILQGRPENAAIILANFADNAAATDFERGRAETLLGLALKEQGRFHAAGQSFETALRLLDTPSQPTADYASALDYDAGLELLKGNIDRSRKLLDHAAAITTQLGNHAQLSSVLVRIAGLETQRQHYREARALLQDAQTEFHLAGDSARNVAPDLYGTSEWLASLTRKPTSRSA